MIALHTKCCGRFKILKYQGDLLLQETQWFDNLITNGGLDFLAANNNYIRGICMGAGNTPPDETDTLLESFVGSTTDRQTGAGTRNPSFYDVSGTPPYYVFARNTFRFGVGVLTGPLREVGVFQSTSTAQHQPTAPLFSRALITDGFGTPIEITVAADQFLDVIYEFRVYAPPTDFVAEDVPIGGDLFTVTGRGINVLSTSLVNGWSITNQGNPLSAGGNALAIGVSEESLPDITANISANPSANTTGVDSYVEPYVPGTYFRDRGLRITNLDAAVFTNGVKTFRSQQSFAPFAFGFVSQTDGHGIRKTNTDFLTLQYRFSWGRR